MLFNWKIHLNKPIAFRTYLTIALGAIALFILYHILVWFFFTSKILSPAPYYVGDLGRMSYQMGSLHPRLKKVDLSQQHLDRDTWNNQHVDVITIGDSFSNAMASGKNPYYQDYLESDRNLSVLNIQNLDETLTYLQSISLLYDSGWLERIHPKAIIIETVANGAFRRVVSDTLPLKLPHPQTRLFHRPWSTVFPTPLFINTANYKMPFYSLTYPFYNHIGGKVYRFDLNESLFSVPNDKNLLIYHEDIDNINDFNDANIDRINTSLNVLARKLKTLNITLYYMPAVDKYDLYYDYIVDKKKYPKNPLFEKLRRTQKEYILIDTKQLFSAELANHTKDLYYADDTHWSYKASQALSKSSYFKELI